MFRNMRQEFLSWVKTTETTPTFLCFEASISWQILQKKFTLLYVVQFKRLEHKSVKKTYV